MATNFDDLIKDALSLSPGERAMLANHLLESLDREEQKSMDAAWAEEAECRAQAIDEGRAKLIPGEQVMAELRARARK